ncbi:MAG: 50S ribosomal protein L13 [Candidatus Aenigmarchaeota archaeon]|nr:50S ribosomal protein L13 [Candidatus Aenigmarchaeota archaeon]
MITIDGKNAVLGRLASHIAQRLLKGEEIMLVNAEKVIITGNKKQIKEKYLARRKKGSPQHGPFFPSRPDMIVKRAVRGMLPYKTNKGRDALRRLRVYVSLPGEIKGEMQTVAAKEISSNFLYVEDLAKTLGWKRQV